MVWVLDPGAACGSSSAWLVFSVDVCNSWAFAFMWWNFGFVVWVLWDVPLVVDF